MAKHRISIRASCAALLAVSCGAQAHASCRLPGERLGPAVQESLRREPRTLLLQYPQGGQGLRGVTVQMAVAGPDTLNAISSLVPLASNIQRQALGIGLATAVNACSKQDPALAKTIAQTATGSGSSVVQRSFNRAIDPSLTDGGAGPRATTALAGPGPGLTPGIGRSLALPGARAMPGPPDPYGDPAGWH